MPLVRVGVIFIYTDPPRETTERLIEKFLLTGSNQQTCGSVGLGNLRVLLHRKNPAPQPRHAHRADS